MCKNRQESDEKNSTCVYHIFYFCTWKNSEAHGLSILENIGVSSFSSRIGSLCSLRRHQQSLASAFEPSGSPLTNAACLSMFENLSLATALSRIESSRGVKSPGGSLR